MAEELEEGQAPRTQGRPAATLGYIQVEDEERIAEILAGKVGKNYRTDSSNNVVVSAYRSGSSASLVPNADGTISTVRRNSAGDIRIAAGRQLSVSSQPNLAAVLGLMPDAPPAPLMMGPQDALERTRGQGDFLEHLWPIEVVAQRYGCSLDSLDPAKSKGLTSEVATKFIQEFGLNVLTPPPRVPMWLLFLLQFTNLLMVLLMITAAITLALFASNPSDLTNMYLGVLLFIAVFITCYETFSQEAKSDQLMEKFRAMVPEQSSTLRDGQWVPVNASELVPGDLIRLKTGDKIPADCRVIQSMSMKVDQSMITGESEAIDIHVESKNQNPLESKNLLFSGSLVVDGGGFALAIRTGDGTLIGKMVDLTGDVGKTSSTLQKDIVYFVRVLTVFALAQAAVVFIVGLSRGLDPTSVFVAGFVTIMVSNVPQGLPTTITACLFIVAERMGQQNVFVKKLDIIESLGSCTCICTDKTGTLTQNLMSVANTWVFNLRRDAKSLGAELAQVKVNVGVQDKLLVLLATLNSRVMLQMKKQDAGDKGGEEKEELVPTGDATELGLYRFCSECVNHISPVGDIEQFRSSFPKVLEFPFNSKNKWQVTVHDFEEAPLPQCPRLANGHQQILFMKGAPDVLMNKCTTYVHQDGTIRPMDDAFRACYTESYDEFGGGGERVLGFALKVLERSIEEETHLDKDFADKLKERLVGAKSPETAIVDLVFVGLVTLRDPPRDEVPQAIVECYSAGVMVVMVTGDHPVTAEAIARNIGLITKPTRRSLAKERKCREDEVDPKDPAIGAVVVRGIEISGGSEFVNGVNVTIPAMTEEDWKVLLSRKEIVFARTSPENKLTIVNEFTKAGHITAMTGDGVNDSPALKQAAIGIAMGKNGSDVAKEAGDIVLLDDNFASIVIGIREGRLLFSNLKKSIAYTLAHLTPEVLPVLLWAFVGIPQPMGAILVLCIDLLTELCPASALAYEKAESLIMQVPPRDAKKDKLTSFALLNYAYFQAGVIEFCVCLFVYFRIYSWYGVSPHDLFANNNRYFPAVDGDIFHTSDGSGRVYSPADQMHIFRVVYASWYLVIVCCQAAHIFVCRTTTISIFEHGIFTNTAVNYSIIIAAALGCFAVYVPGITDITLADNAFSLEIFYATLWGTAALWGWAEGRKWVTRNYPGDHWFNRTFAW